MLRTLRLRATAGGGAVNLKCQHRHLHPIYRVRRRRTQELILSTCLFLARRLLIGDSDKRVSLSLSRDGQYTRTVIHFFSLFALINHRTSFGIFDERSFPLLSCKIWLNNNGPFIRAME